MRLDQMTTAELQEELARRSRVDSKPPQVLSEKEQEEGIAQLRRMAEEYVDEVAATRNPDSDWHHWMFEAVMHAFYGKDFWAWHKRVRR